MLKFLLRSKKIACKYYLGTTVQVHYLNKNAILRILQSTKLFKKISQIYQLEKALFYITIYLLY
jgi:hypothetical protein